jgi:signal peptidase
VSRFEGTDVHQILQRATSVLLVLLIVALVVPFVVYAFPALVGANHSFVVLSGSMEPAISPGDVVVVDAVPADAIAVGDVITFRSPGSDVPVTHRVIDVTEGPEGQRAFVTQGDANEDPDLRTVTGDAVVGRVIVTMPYVGQVVQFADSPVGFVALVLVPVGLLILNEVGTMVLAGRRDADSTDAVGAGETTSLVGESAGGDADDSGLADDAPEVEGGFTVSQTDLTLTSVALGALAVYSVFVGLTTRDALSIAVAVGSTTTVLLALGVRQFGFGDPVADQIPAATDGGAEATARPVSAAGATATVIPAVSLPPELGGDPRVGVGSLADLGDVAAQTGRPLVRDAATGAYLVIDGAATYAFNPDAVVNDEPSGDGHEADRGVGDAADGDTTPEEEIR